MAADSYYVEYFENYKFRKNIGGEKFVSLLIGEDDDIFIFIVDQKITRLLVNLKSISLQLTNSFWMLSFFYS